jgi:hypothetical protein
MKSPPSETTSSVLTTEDYHKPRKRAVDETGHAETHNTLLVMRKFKRCRMAVFNKLGTPFRTSNSKMVKIGRIFWRARASFHVPRCIRVAIR